MEYLKLCPFCGGFADVEFGGRQMRDGTIKGYFRVQCKFCPASVCGGYFHGKEEDLHEPIEETIGALKAIKNWNRRCGE